MPNENSAGRLNLSDKTFTPASDIPTQDWQRSVKNHLAHQAKIENLLPKDVKFFPSQTIPGTFSYECDFYPARYSPVFSRGTTNPHIQGHHFVFDYLQDEKHLVDRSIVAQGQKSWLLRDYYLQLVQSPPKQEHETIIASVVRVVEEKQKSPLGRVIALSETHRHINEHHLNKHG
jgi:hypothetical protein